MSAIFQQSAAAGHFGFSLTATTTLPSNTVATNTLALLVTHTDFGALSPTITVADGQASYSLSKTISTNNGRPMAGIFVRQAIAGGSVGNIVATSTSGTAANSYGYIYALELNGLQNLGIDGFSTNSANTSTTPSTGATATLSSAASMALCVFAANTSFAGATVPPNTGWTTLFSDLTNASQTPTVFAYQHVNATTALNANIGTLSAADAWSAVIITLQDSAAVGGTSPQMLMMGVG
jgi:hypothetical protein